MMSELFAGMFMKKLILFDFDDTLVNAYRFHEEAVFKAFKEALGIKVNLAEYDVDGFTAEWFLRHILELNNASKSLFSRVSSLYQEHFVKSFNGSNKAADVVLPGVRGLLKKLDKNHVLAVLSGTPKLIIETVLNKTNLMKHFLFLISGDGEENRLNLYKQAIEEAKILGISKKDIVVIGNSVNEIQCSKQLGLKMIVVATGSFSLKELKKFEPDFVFQDLSETEKVLKAIEK
jgi:phosphoglycolate phosphatase-like HAD superfamily hydrolase